LSEYLTPENTPSLGWEMLDWYEAYLRVPSGPDYGKPLRLTDEQARIIVSWYSVDRKTGRFNYRRGAVRRNKGWGKSPLLAAWGIGEFVGPVLFDGWDANGQPVGKPWPTPWEQIAACSEDQTGNTYSALYAMLADSPALDEFGIDLGRTKAFLRDRPGCVIEPVTASAGSREGQPLTAAVLDETHLWLPSQGGRRLAATLRRNLGKMNGRSLESTNAFLPGEGSVAEETHKMWEKGGAGLFCDAVEAPWVDDLADKRALRRALRVAYGDAKWVDLTRVIAEIQDPATDPSDARRYYLNQLVRGEWQAVDPHRWAELARPDVTVPDGTRIGVGFDGSISDDATALRGCTEDGHRFTIAVWERPMGAQPGWRVPRLEVEAKVAETFERFDVGRMLCDPAKWWTEIETWADRWNSGRSLENARVVVFDTNKTSRMAPACDRYLTAHAEHSSTHDGDAVTTRHALAMAKKKVRFNDPDDDGRTRYVFVKMDVRKIDAGIADVLALEAAMTMPGADAASVYEERDLVLL
jgi:hypothetical protein